MYFHVFANANNIFVDGGVVQSNLNLSDTEYAVKTLVVHLKPLLQKYLDKTDITRKRNEHFPKHCFHKENVRTLFIFRKFQVDIAFIEATSLFCETSKND